MGLRLQAPNRQENEYGVWGHTLHVVNRSEHISKPVDIFAPAQVELLDVWPWQVFADTYPFCNSTHLCKFGRRRPLNGTDSCDEVETMKMMRSGLMLLAVAVLLGACVRTSGGPDEVTLTRGEMQSLLEKNQAQILDRFNLAAAKFYEETSDSYYILSYEYFNLSKALQDQGKTEQAEKFKQISAICLDHQKDLQALADKCRDGLSPVTKAMEPKVPGAAPAPAQTVKNVSVSPTTQPKAQQQQTIAHKPEAMHSQGTTSTAQPLIKPAMQSSNQ